MNSTTGAKLLDNAFLEVYGLHIKASQWQSGVGSKSSMSVLSYLYGPEKSKRRQTLSLSSTN